MSTKKYDYLIVGAGLFGSVFAYMATKRGKKCLVIDKRCEVGGNVHCEEISGITLHKYGPHIFHTSDEEVWEFVNQFVSFNNYTNRPIAKYYDETYNLPFNMNTFTQIYGNLNPIEMKKRISEDSEKYEVIENLEEQAISMVGNTIYEKLIKHYTEKQWGKKCTELPLSIIKRLPLRFTFDNNYFKDKYQGIPNEGYNVLFEKLLDGIEVQTNTDYFSNREYFDKISKMIVYTGKIDEFFDYQFGELEYRSIIFENKLIGVSNFQGNAVVNYTSPDKPYTRITEHKFFTCLDENSVNDIPITFVTEEYSTKHINGENDPMYPINTNENLDKYYRYLNLSSSYKNVIFGGRLGTYKYMDMDKVIKNALNYFK